MVVLNSLMFGVTMLAQEEKIGRPLSQPEICGCPVFSSSCFFFFFFVMLCPIPVMFLCFQI